VKAQLYFDHPEDKEVWEVTNKAKDLQLIIWHLNDWLKSELKWNDKLTSQEYDQLSKCQNKLFELMEENGCKQLF